ncbi:MAG: hypothetical protein M1824_002688 [Vezdaea acicularis]|nr:MAG: hypothetical protein M1824_002688 [Vezdaea acicularis]
MKKLIIACDGTWNDADNGFVRDSLLPWDHSGHLAVPSNVTRFCRATKATDAKGIPQIVYYQAGVGSAENIFDKYVGGGTGQGLSEHIREAYGFLTNNYEDGDEIYLVGFSRGAFTARSIAGLVSLVGVMTKLGMEHFYRVYEDYRNNHDPDYRPQGRHPFPDRPNIKTDDYKRTLFEMGMTRVNTDIHAIGVWDTVGSLGIPQTGLLEFLGFMNVNRNYLFHNTSLTNSIKNAFQALGLDEKRAAFSPSVWEKPENVTTKLKQVWFPGVHTNIGGGYDDQNMSDITLTWMCDEFSPFIEFDKEYLLHEYKHTQEVYEHNDLPSRSWANGKLYNSYTGFTRIFGSKTRTPGNYTLNDPKTGKPSSTPLVNTNEYLHPSVRVRYGKGLGTNDKGVYKPAAMADWRVIPDERGDESEATAKSSGHFKWHYQGVKTQGMSRTMLEESYLGEMERVLLKLDDEQYKRYLLDEQPAETSRG